MEEKKIEDMTADERSQEAQVKILEILKTYKVSIGVQTNPIVVDNSK